jgi:hypothetical protein
LPKPEDEQVVAVLILDGDGQKWAGAGPACDDAITERKLMVRRGPNIMGSSPIP